MADKNNQSNPVALNGLTIINADNTMSNTNIVIENGAISDISNNKINNKNIKTINFTNNEIAMPGMIDLHIHGSNGADVMDATPEALQTISQSIAKNGTTSFLATTITESVNSTLKAINNVHQHQSNQLPHTKKQTRSIKDSPNHNAPPHSQPSDGTAKDKQETTPKHNINTQNKIVGAEILGMHLEGPFISKENLGAHRHEFALEPDVGLIDKFNIHKNIKLVTLAPELQDCDKFINHLKQNNIIASIGHTKATYKQTQHAIAQGCNHATHLYNAMTGIHHRTPGAAAAILANNSVIAELIVDGIHVSPEMINWTLGVKGIDSLILVTDAMRAACCADGEYDLGGQTVIVKKNQARIEDGTLAGSVLTMRDAMVNFKEFTNCSLQDLALLTAQTPAKHLNIFDRKGSIEVGKDADLVIYNQNLEIVYTICNGNISHPSQ